MTRHHDTTPFVATDLVALDWPVLSEKQTDVEVDGRVYRRLDPEYYAWLRRRMEEAKSKTDAGRYEPSAFDALRTRFNTVHDQAIALFGRPALLEAIQRLDPDSYRWPGSACKEPEGPAHAEIPEDLDSPSRCSPESRDIPGESQEGWSDHCYPEEDDRERFKFRQGVTRHAVAQAKSIRDEALAKGWPEAELYRTRGRFAFPCGKDWGLVCFIHMNQKLGAVTEETIALVRPDGHTLRFHRRPQVKP